MSTLGVRCSTTDFTYAVLEGSKIVPILHEVNTVAFPKGYEQPEKLKWLFQELELINSQHNVSTWAIKGAEPIAAKGKSFVLRVEFEAVVSLSAASIGSTSVFRKVKPTIAKDLGLKGRAKSLVEDLDHSLISGLNPKKTKEFEAIVVAWSCLS